MKETTTQQQSSQTRPVTRFLSPMEMATIIKAEATKNPVFNAVCHLFAVRERARSQVTLSTLMVSMSREGYNFNREQLEGVLEFLAHSGVGRLAKNSKGRVHALKDIKYTLQSVGRAGSDKATTVDKFVPNTTYSDLPQKALAAVIPTPRAPEPVAAPPTPEVAPAKTIYPAVLTITAGGKPVNFEIPNGLTSERLALLLSEIYRK